MKTIKSLFIIILGAACFLGFNSCEKETENNLVNENADENGSESESITWADLAGTWTIADYSGLTAEISKIARQSYDTQSRLPTLDSNSKYDGFILTEDGYSQPVTVKITSGLGNSSTRVASLAVSDGYVSWHSTSYDGASYLGSIEDHLNEDGNYDEFFMSLSNLTCQLAYTMTGEMDSISLDFSLLIINYGNGNAHLYERVNSLGF